MPLVNQVLSELIGEPTKKEKQDIQRKSNHIKVDQKLLLLQN